MQLDRLTIGYEAGWPLLQPVSETLAPATFTALLGRNGCGKSTLLRTLAGLQPALSGSVTGPTPAVVLTALPDLPHTTALQMAAYGRLPHTGWLGRLRPADLEAARRALRLTGVEALADRPFTALSDGERQKVMIARALAQGNEVLLLDEPAAFLDYPSRRQLMALLVHLAHDEGKTILLSTHDVELALAHADRLWVLRDGQLRVLDPSGQDPETVI